MTREQIAQAALDMAAETIAEGDYHERHVVAATIRAIAPAEVLAKVGDERCAKCGHPRRNHPYRHPFVGMGNDPSATQPAPDDVARLVQATIYARNRLEMIADESWHGDGRDLKRSITGVFREFDEAIAACKAVRDE